MNQLLFSYFQKKEAKAKHQRKLLVFYIKKINTQYPLKVVKSAGIEKKHLKVQHEHKRGIGLHLREEQK